MAYDNEKNLLWRMKVKRAPIGDKERLIICTREKFSVTLAFRKGNKQGSPGLLEAFPEYPQLLYSALNRLGSLSSGSTFGTTSLAESPACAFEIR